MSKFFNFLMHPFSNLIRLLIFLVQKLKFKEIHWGCQVCCPSWLSYRCIVLKNGVIIRQNSRIEGVFCRNGIVYSPEIVLGQNVHVEQNCHITCASRIEVGQNTAIAANVTITDIHHPYDDITVPIEKQDLIVKPVFIGEDCKIYNNSVILQGVTIGKHVTIAANSTVTHDIPDYCVAVGSPAFIVKRYNFVSQKWEKTDKQGNFYNYL